MIKKSRYILIVALSLYFGSEAIFAADSGKMTPDLALKELIDGNARYMQDVMSHADSNSQRREAVLKVQEPFAIILGCSDSRVSPEIIFDQGIGDLFVVRVAGNVLGPIVLDSIEYAAAYLKSSLILVLGHENCGAVKAVLAGKTKEIEAIAEFITPAVEIAKKEDSPVLENAIKLNVERMVSFLSESPVLKKIVQKGNLKIQGAYYDLDTGKVTLLPAFQAR